MREMKVRLPGPYAGTLALSSTGSMGYTGSCSTLKNHQTNAVIWRVGRFAASFDRVAWRSDAPTSKRPNSSSDPDCVNLFTDRNGNSQDRVANVAVRLYDPLAQKHVTVASIHWPTSDWGGPDCADENMREASFEVDGLGGSSLKIVAGDANTTVGSRGWWNDAHDDGYQDPIGDRCPADGCPPGDKTFGDRRIDYILAKSSAGFGSAKTITPTGPPYSDHKALTAYIRY